MASSSFHLTTSRNCRCYYRLQKVKNYEFTGLTYGTTSTPNFINFRRHSLFMKFMQTDITCEGDELGWVGLG
jgi:hypothetical protein